MSSKPETNFRKRFVPKLKQIPRTMVISIQQLSLVGTPDLLLCVNGRFVAIELKASATSKISPLQKRNLDLITEAGGYGFICYPENEAEILEAIKMIATKGETK